MSEKEEIETTDETEKVSAEPKEPGTESRVPGAILQAEFEQLKTERDAAVKALADVKDDFLRKAADLENSRKRLARDKEESIKNANKGLLTDLVGVIDDLERAIKSAETSKEYATLHDGVLMIEKQFVGMLERKYGLTRFESAGTPFDPERHEAVAAEDRDDHHESIVLEDYQKGYILNEKVLRTAKVKVSNPTKTDGPSAAAE